MNKIMLEMAKSWSHKGGIVYSTDELLEWISERNKNSVVTIKKTELPFCDPWFYDPQDGSIHNDKHSFFSIMGIRKTFASGETVEQPVLLQNEIGYLGILCKEIGGVIHFLMQAKIEPGNVNKIQISPTIQATKSNFTQMHGGRKPAYLEYFLSAKKGEIILDQIQSEQSSRFLGKRNRNILILVNDNDDVPVLDSHRWMTLGQIKQLMRYDNLVNMDTRTVISCLPFFEMAECSRDELAFFSDQPLLSSITAKHDLRNVIEIYNYFNDYKMLSYKPPLLCPLHELKDWEMRSDGIFCKREYPFHVVYCDIEIEGREVRRWKQPLFEATGIATFGLLMYEDEGKLNFIVKANPEIGCFDAIELAPTYQRESTLFADKENDPISQLFEIHLEKRNGLIFDHLLSEEGGRFYHEQNRNILMLLNKKDIPKLPEGYFSLDFAELNRFTQINNILNIQLRNLLSLLEV